MNVLKRMGIGSKLTLMLLVMTTTSAVQAADFTVNLVDGDGAAVSGFRWVLQEDTTYAVDPTNPGAITGQLGLNFHKSHHPIALNSAGLAEPPTVALSSRSVVPCARISRIPATHNSRALPVRFLRACFIRGGITPSSEASFCSATSVNGTS